MPQPLVSVLMTAYNREAYIAQAIESVLASGYQNFELIIIDDASVDQTAAIAQSYAAHDGRIKVQINAQNLGDYPNRNRAAILASGEYIKYLDSDDLFYPYSLEVFVHSMERYPEAALGVISRRVLTDAPFPLLLSSRQAYLNHFFGAGLLDYGPSGVIIRRSHFESIGRFSGKRFIGDQECWLRLAARYPVLELHPSLTFWRQHEGQEYQLGTHMLDGGYFLMVLPLLREILEDPCCPLSIAEKYIVMRKQEKMSARELIKQAIRTGNFAKAFRLMQELNITPIAAF